MSTTLFPCMLWCFFNYEPYYVHFDDWMIEILWKRGVSPTEIADKMSFLSECRDAENLRAEMIEDAKCK